MQTAFAQCLHSPKLETKPESSFGCRYEFQMQFGSIGWSVGATLGYAQALKGKKRVLASIGDGSFQVTAQVSFVLCMLCLKCTMLCQTRACCGMIAHSQYNLQFEMQ